MLIQVIHLVFKKAMNKATWFQMYGRLCRKMIEQIGLNVHDDRIKNPNGKPIDGGQLFHKYLLNRCQGGFEHEWVTKEAAAVQRPCTHRNATLCTKRQSLGLTMFIGEFFKMQMLTKLVQALDNR